MAGALSNGPKKNTGGNEKKTFVFGSSTPRDLSYMYSVPATLRAYDSKIKPVKRSKDQTLSHYMRQARSVTRNQSGSREGSSDRTVRGTFAFGSSTPRILSHLCSRTGENGSNLEVGRRSYTTPTFSTSRSKTSTSTNARMKGTDKAIQKPSDRAASKSTCPISPTSYQSKERNEEIMNSVEVKLEVENDKVRPMNKIATKEQWKSEKVDGSESLAHLPEEALKKSSSLSAGFGNEEENVLLTKEPKSEITFPEGRKLSTAANAVEDDDSQLLLSTALTSTEKIKAEKIAKDSSGTEREREERRNIDESIQLRSTGRDNLTRRFETTQELTINSEFGEHERSLLTTPTAPITDSRAATNLSSSAVDRTFYPSNNNGELKDKCYRKSLTDQIKDAERETSSDSGSQLLKTEGPIPEDLTQPMQAEDASSEHKIIYNNSYQPEAPVPQQCVKISEREERKSNDISVL